MDTSESQSLHNLAEMLVMISDSVDELHADSVDELHTGSVDELHTGSVDKLHTGASTERDKIMSYAKILYDAACPPPASDESNKIDVSTISKEYFLENLPAVELTMMHYVRKFVEEHGGIPRITDLQYGLPVGIWTHLKRCDNMNGKDVGEIRGAFESLPGWTWSYCIDSYDEMFFILSMYMSNPKNPIPIPRDMIHFGIGLGAWVRLIAFEHEKSRLGVAITEMFEQFPRWRWNDYAEKPSATNDDLVFRSDKKSRWGKIRGQVLKFVLMHGRFPCAMLRRAQFGPNMAEHQLGVWVQRQKSYYHSRAVSMTNARISLLQKIPGWEWGADVSAHNSDSVWMMNYEVLKTFIRKFGHYPAATAVYKGVNIGPWTFRQQRMRVFMDTDKLLLLEGIPGWEWRNGAALTGDTATPRVDMTMTRTTMKRMFVV